MMDVWFGQVWDEVVKRVLTVSEFGQNVFYSRKFPVTSFPSAYVHPVIATATPKTFRESEWVLEFRIYIVVENTDPKAGILLAWQLGWKVASALLTDQTLGDLLHNLECGPIVDSPERLGRGTEQHWIALTVRCIRKL